MGALDLTTLHTPVSLAASHRLDSFRSTEPVLDDWLKRRALKSHQSGACRCFVVLSNNEVVGFYALAAGAVMHDQAPGSIRRNMPEPIPVVVLGRLAVHIDWVGHGIGAGLLKDAVLRNMRLSEELGIRAMVCHAMTESAKTFYLKYGFVESPTQPLTVMYRFHVPNH